ncbi:ORF74 [Silurid herpesvirus 1]|nr:ORF74 [Silurid herpesvirus 1]
MATLVKGGSMIYVNEPPVVPKRAPPPCDCRGGVHYHGAPSRASATKNRARGSDELAKCYDKLLKNCAMFQREIPEDTREFLDTWNREIGGGIVFRDAALAADSVLDMAPFGFETRALGKMPENVILEQPRGKPEVVVDFDRSDPLASGTRSRLYKHNGNGYLVSHIRKRSVGEGLDEAMIATRLRHANLVKFLGGVVCAGPEGENCSIRVVELGLCSAEELILEAHWVAPSFALVKRYLLRKMELETLSALSFLHECGVVHGDFRGDKIITFCRGDDFVFKVSLGESTTLGAAPALERPPRYRAPETDLTGLVGRAADMWAWALTLYRVHAGRDFFRGDDTVDTYVVLGRMGNDILDSYLFLDKNKRVTEEGLGFGHRLRQNLISPEDGFLRLMGKCLTLYPQFRPKARTLVTNPRYEGVRAMSTWFHNQPERVRERNNKPPPVPAILSCRVKNGDKEYVSTWGVRRAPSMDDRLERREVWGRSAVQACGAFIPPFLYRENSAVDARPGYRIPITVTRKTMRYYIGKEHGVQTEVHTAAGADIVVHKKIGRHDDLSRASVEYLIALSNRNPNVFLTVNQYTVGVCNIHVYLAYIVNDLVFGRTLGFNPALHNKKTLGERNRHFRGMALEHARVDLLYLLMTRGMAYVKNTVEFLKAHSLLEAGPHAPGIVFTDPTSSSSFRFNSYDDVRIELGDEPAQVIVGTGTR